MDRLKISFKYFTLGVLYIILLLLRLLCFISIKDIETEWFKRLIYIGPSAGVIIFFFICNRMGMNSTVSTILFISTIFIIGFFFIVSLFCCEFEYLLDSYLRKEFDKCEERFGKKKEGIKTRNFCEAARETSHNFFGYAWIFAIITSVLIFLYIQTTPEKNRLGQVFGVFIIIMSYGWKKRSFFYINRYKNEYRERDYYKRQNTYQNTERNTYNNSYDNHEQTNFDTHSPVGCGYFNGCTTVKEVKKIYHDLARTLHPDAGGDADKFRMLKEEYEYVMKKWNVK